MSEPSTLYTKIHISKENLEVFLNSEPSDPIIYTDWKNWMESKRIYSSENIENTISSIGPAGFDNIENLIDYFKTDRYNICFFDYDENSEIMELSIIFFSENYGEMIPVLTALRGIENYSKGNNEDFIVIFDYWWGTTSIEERLENQNGFINALIVFKDNNTMFIEQPNSKVKKHIIEYFSKKQEKLDEIVGE